jgi:hypothetical protein
MDKWATGEGMLRTTRRADIGRRLNPFDDGKGDYALSIQIRM